MSGRRLLPLLAGGLVLLTLGSVATVAVFRSHPAGTVSHSRLDWDGLTRTYRLFVPDSLGGSHAQGLVVVLHGYHWSADSFAEASGMDAAAGARRWVAVYPDGWHNSWDAGTCCGDAVAAGLDDVAFLGALAGTLARRYGVPAGRVFAAGFSNGAMLSLRAACEAPGLFAAVASVSGEQEVGDCASGPPVSVLQVHGTADDVVRFPGLVRTSSPGASVLDWWARRDGCHGSSQVTRGPLTITGFSGCGDGSAVTEYAIAGGGHEWPRKGALDAAAVVADFLATHSR